MVCDRTVNQTRGNGTARPVNDDGRATPVAPAPLIGDDLRRVDNDCSARQGDPPTRSVLLAELLKKPGTYDQIDSAWRLAMWLMVAEKGVAVGGYDEIAKRLGNVSRHTVKNWADSLETNGVVERKPKGKRVELRLTGDYMRVAAAPDVIHVETTAVQHESPALLSLKKIIEGTGELGGQVALTISGCDFGGGRR